MGCKHTATLVHGYIDRELDEPRRKWFEAHVLGCAACAHVVAQERALSAALRRAAPRYAAPPLLAARIGEALDAASAPARGSSRAWQLAASLAAVTVLSSGLTWFALTRQNAPEDDLRVSAAVVDSHVRALMTDRMTVVASSDQHTVKPWFAGRVDVSPPVTDFAADGFPLLGGRVDYVERRAAAVLVYRHRQHLIDVYVWPQGSAGTAGEATRNGYNTVRWSAGGLAFAAVSDLNRDDLRRFVGLMQAAAR